MKNMVVFFLCLLMAVRPALAAVPTDAAYWNMNRSLAGVTDQALESRGYSSTDPRTYSTLQSMSNVATNTAGAAAGAAAGVGVVTLAGITAPAWASVVLFAVVSSIVGYGVTMGLNGLVNWLWHSNHTIDESGNPLPVTTTTSMNAGGQFWKVVFISGNVNIQFAGGDGEAIARQGYYQYLAQTGQSTNKSPTCTISSSMVTCSPIQATLQPSGAPGSCVAGTYWSYSSGQCSGYTFPFPSGIPSKTGASLQTAVNDLPASELSKPLNPQLVAAVANSLWQQAAAQPGYSGFPYPQDNPITTEEAQAWQQANPTLWPTVGDFVSPRSTTTDPNAFALPSNATSPTVSPTTATNPSVTNPASSQPLANLGPDPATPQPTLEDIPTAHDILAPLLNLMPDLRSFQVPAHSGDCPKPQFTVWGTQYQLDAHCTLIESNQATIEAAFYLVWTILALFIVLSA